MNIERPTSNNIFCQFKKSLSNTRRKRLRCTSESVLRNSTRLPSTGSGPEHIEGSRSTLSFSTKSPSVVSSGLETQGRTTHDRKARRRLRFACFKIGKNVASSIFDVGRSMFDVQSVHCSGQAESHTKFHTSAAAGLWPI